MNSPSYCLQKMLWQYTYEIYINTLIAIIYFLSKHHLQGGDREQHSKTIALVISIHTTRKVVTKDPRGTIIAKLFQSTPPARWWPLIFPSSSQDVDFNPHHPQGGDMDEVLKTELIRISIHTTRKVVTMTWPVVDICLLFQSTPPARWWPFLWWIKRGLYQISIHTTRKVVTPFQHTMVQPWNFNPHHPQGGDLVLFLSR